MNTVEKMLILAWVISTLLFAVGLFHTDNFGIFKMNSMLSKEHQKNYQLCNEYTDKNKQLDCMRDNDIFVDETESSYIAKKVESDKEIIFTFGFLFITSFYIFFDFYYILKYK